MTTNQPAGDVPDLLPCPFCGGEPDTYIVETNNGHAVYCPSCDALGPEVWRQMEAIEEWNTRAPSPAPDVGERGEALSISKRYRDQKPISHDEADLMWRVFDAALSPKAAPNVDEIKRETIAAIGKKSLLSRDEEVRIKQTIDYLYGYSIGLLASQPAQPREADAVPNYPVIPEGWKLVPIEPTDCMAVAGSRASEGKDEVRPSVARDIYKAMLAAAPEREKE